MILHNLPWVAGIGSLVYFAVALLKPAWFLGGDALAEAEAEEAYTAPISTL